MKRSHKCDPKKPTAPIIKTLFFSTNKNTFLFNHLSSYAFVMKAQLLHLFKIEKIPSVENYFIFKQRNNFIKIRCPKFTPFGSDHQGISLFQCLITALAKYYLITYNSFYIRHCFRVK